MSSYTLHDFVLSASCFKVRLFMGILELSFDTVPVDMYPGHEHRSEAFRSISPLGELPVLDDGQHLICGADACLVYLATAYDATGRWYPTDDPVRLAEITLWLDVGRSITSTVGAAREWVNFGVPGDIDTLRSHSHEQFAVLDEHLWFRERSNELWLAIGDAPTIADLSLFPDVAMAEEGGVSLLDYPAIVRWADRVRQIPGFSVMPGVFHFGRS